MFLSISQLGCACKRASVKATEKIAVENHESILNDFVHWHNEYFSGANRPITQNELSAFFAEDIYFEVNGKQVAQGLAEMIPGYEKIKNKGHKLVDIEAFEDKRITQHNHGVTEIWVKHDVTIVYNDGNKKVFKAEASYFIKSNRIFRYIEKFGI